MLSLTWDDLDPEDLWREEIPKISGFFIPGIPVGYKKARLASRRKII